MKRKVDILDAVFTGLAVYGAYKVLTHPKTKKITDEVKNFFSLKTPNKTVDYVSEEEADNNIKNEYVNVTPSSPCHQDDNDFV